MIGHGKIICKVCGEIIGSCRCMCCNENIKFDMCEKCKDANKNIKPKVSIITSEVGEKYCGNCPYLNWYECDRYGLNVRREIDFPIRLPQCLTEFPPKEKV